MLALRPLLSLFFIGSVSISQAFLPALRSNAAVFSRSSHALALAAPGVVLSSVESIKDALSNPQTVVLDARRVDEIEASGYWQTDCQWVHAPCTPDGDCPLLSVAADALLRDKEAPVIVYCASGKRASVAKGFLQDRGFTTVLNAGGFPGDFEALLD